jgi:hypothetical protein
VLEEMQKYRIRRIAIENMPVLAMVVGCIENMAEQLFAQFFQKEVLGFKMRIECGSANVRLPDDLAHGDLTEIPFG